MSIRHASEESVSNGNFPIPDIPDGSSISETTVVQTNGTGTLSFSFTSPATGGVPSSISILSSPDASLVINNQTSSSFNISGNFLLDTVYQLSISATNQSGTRIGTALPLTVSSSKAGYFGGSESYVQTVDKLSFNNDSRLTLSTGLSIATGRTGAMANSGVAGYIGGGFLSGFPYNVSTVNKFSFSDDSRTTLTLSNGKYSPGAFANSGTAGYFGGGYYDQGGGNAIQNSIEKFLFPSDSRSTLAATLSVRRQEIAGFSNNGVAGYFCGGYVFSPQSWVATVDKLSFSNDSVSTSTSLSGNRSAAGGMANSGTAGYVGGGNTSGGFASSIVDKFAFSNDSRTTLGTGLSSSKRYVGGASDNGISGYFAAGGIDKFSFPSDSRTTLAQGLSSNQSPSSGMANSGII